MIYDPDDGSFRFRQSWLNTAQRCPEKGRREIVQPELRGTTDEALIGTAAHYGIEAVVNGEYSPDNIASAVENYYQWDPDGELVDFKFTKRNSVQEMLEVSVNCAEAWVTDLMPHFPLGDAKAEVGFDVPIMEHRGHPIRIAGTVDLAPAVPSLLADWKTSGRDYSQKNKQRWAIQPTIYSLAAVLGGVRDDVAYGWPMRFRYGVMVKLANRARGQIVEVERTAAHAAFAIERMKSWVDLFLDFGTDRPWPLIDEDNFLCSATWCDFYDQCRGRFIAPDLDLFGYTPK